MYAILPMVLALAALADPPASPDEPVLVQPAPVTAVLCGDWIDLALLLEDPCVETCVVGVWPYGDMVLVAAVHSVDDAAGSAFSWMGYYAFPSSIYAHSVVSVPFKAEEMD